MFPKHVPYVLFNIFTDLYLQHVICNLLLFLQLTISNSLLPVEFAHKFVGLESDYSTPSSVIELLTVHGPHFCLFACY